MAAWITCLRWAYSPGTMALVCLLLLTFWMYVGEVTIEYRSLSGPRSRPGGQTGRRGVFRTHSQETSSKVKVDETAQWQITDRADLLYLYNAYFDNVEDPEVRVVAMGDEKHIRRWQSVHCLFWNGSESTPSKATGYLEHVRDAHSKRYVAMFAHCPLNDGTRPKEVSVTFNDTSTVYNRLPVRYPSTHSVNVRFTVCYCVVHSNFSRYRTLVQALELDRLLGASRAVVYLHGSFPGLASTLRYYQAAGFLEIVDWRVAQPRQIHYYAQITAMNDCLYRNLHRSQYVVYHDMDEVLLPRVHHSWTELMDNLTHTFPDGAAFGFRCSYVNEMLPETPELLPRDVAPAARRLGLNFLLRTRRENFVYAPKWRSKMIIIPKRVAVTGIHCIWRARKATREYFMDPALGLNFHYRTKWILNDTRTDTSVIGRYARQLVSRVQKVVGKVSSH